MSHDRAKTGRASSCTAMRPEYWQTLFSATSLSLQVLLTSGANTCTYSLFCHPGTTVRSPRSNASTALAATWTIEYVARTPHTTRQEHHGAKAVDIWELIRGLRSSTSLEKSQHKERPCIKASVGLGCTFSDGKATSATSDRVPKGRKQRDPHGGMGSEAALRFVSLFLPRTLFR